MAQLPSAAQFKIVEIVATITPDVYLVEFNSSIEENLNNGWRLHGGLNVVAVVQAQQVYYSYHQAMIKF